MFNSDHGSKSMEDALVYIERFYLLKYTVYSLECQIIDEGGAV